MHFELTQHVATPPDQAFAGFTDFEHAAEHITAIQNIKLLTTGPIGEGTRFAETRTVFGKPTTETMTITGYTPGQSYTVEAISCGAEYRCTFTFSPDAEGTRVTLTIDTRPLTLLAKVTSPLGLLFAGSMKKMMRQDLADAAAHCERTATAGA